MCERLKQSVLKTDVPERVPGVRIPLPPPRSLPCCFLWDVLTGALKPRSDDEYRPLTRLTDHFALLADSAVVFVCETLHACENRIGVEMRFRDHFRFKASAAPGIVEVGRE